jgi:hypothetical protein
VFEPASDQQNTRISRDNLLDTVAQFISAHRVDLERFALVKRGALTAPQGSFGPLIQDWHSVVDEVWNHELTCAPEKSMFVSRNKRCVNRFKMIFAYIAEMHEEGNGARRDPFCGLFALMARYEL